VNLRHKVYILICPFEEQICYVGCSQDPESRVKQHIGAIWTSSQARKRRDWVRRLKDEKVIPEMRIIAAFDDRYHAELFEASLIKGYLLAGCLLYNRTHIKWI